VVSHVKVAGDNSRLNSPHGKEKHDANDEGQAVDRSEEGELRLPRVIIEVSLVRKALLIFPMVKVIVFLIVEVPPLVVK